MRGRRAMIMAVTTSFVTMLCQGCTHTPSIISYGPAEEPTYAMLLATADPTIAGQDPHSIEFAAATGEFEQRLLAANSLPVAVLGPLSDARANNDNPAGISFTTTRFSSPMGFDSANLSSVTALQEMTAGLAAVRLSPDYDIKENVSGSLTLSAPASATGLGLDMTFAPRASVRTEGGLQSRRVGAELRLGEGLDERGQRSSARSWYVFAAQDGEALCWDVGDAGWSPMADVRLRDQVTVGDLQAGLSINRMGGQFSVSYIRREVSYGDRALSASQTEDFAGISFTLRR